MENLDKGVAGSVGVVRVGDVNLILTRFFKFNRESSRVVTIALRGINIVNSHKIPDT